MKSNKNPGKFIIIQGEAMSKSNNNPLILIYYNIRGKLQVVRNLLCFLNLPFTELHIELIEAGIEKPEP